VATCKVFGYIRDGEELPVEGVLVQFIPVALPAINVSSGDIIQPRVLSAVSSSTGYFYKDLRINTDFTVIIKAAGLKETIRIPDANEVNLFDLTSTYVSGDPTPEDTNEDTW